MRFLHNPVGKLRDNGSNNHGIPVSKLSKDAQDVLREHRLDDREVVFSLRLTNLERIWGLREGRVLRILWFDPVHEIMPKRKIIPGQQTPPGDYHIRNFLHSWGC